MEKLLQSLNEVMSLAQKLCANMQNAVTYANNITKEADEKLKKATDMEISLEAKIRNISDREARVSKIEDIVKIEDDGKAIAKQNKEAMAKLEAFKEAFEEERKKVLKDIGEKFAKIRDENFALDKGWKALRDKESNYRTEIEKEIMLRFKK